MGRVLYTEQEGVHVLRFEGDVRLSLGPTISSFLDRVKRCSAFKTLIVDMSATTSIDSTALGLVAKIGIYCREEFGQMPSIVSSNEDVTRVLKSMAMQEVFLITNEAITSFELIELPQEMASEEAMRDQVLEAHKTLMALNEENQEKFCDLVEALEVEALEVESLEVEGQKEEKQSPVAKAS